MQASIPNFERESAYMTSFDANCGSKVNELICTYDLHSNKNNTSGINNSNNASFGFGGGNGQLSLAQQKVNQTTAVMQQNVRKMIEN